VANDITIADWSRQVVAELSSPAQRQLEIAQYALITLAAVQVINRAAYGYAPSYITRVDGRIGALLTSVNPRNGVIEFEFEVLDDVLRWIHQALVDGSPVVSGDYEAGHIVLADGKPFDIAGRIPPAQEYRFTNTVPYARKIEIGTTESGRAFVIQVRPRLYERVGNQAAARFGNRADISHGFMAVDEGAIGDWAGSASAESHGRSKGGSAKSQAEWLRRQPVIIVRNRS
jgi:hypothetical protein